MHQMTLDFTDRIAAMMEMAVEVQNHFSMRNLGDYGNQGGTCWNLGCTLGNSFLGSDSDKVVILNRTLGRIRLL